MIRLGTVGTSAICDGFISGAALTGKIELAAVYSRSPISAKAFAQKHGCKTWFCDLLQMAQSGSVEAVYIASPNSCHAEQCRIFLENGIHVICEKPIVAQLEDYIELKKLADEKQLIFLEAMIPRHVAHYQAIKSAVEALGNIKMARLDFCQRSSRYDQYLAGEKVNIFDMSLCAGTLMDIGVYCVSAALDFFGMPKSITATANTDKDGTDLSGSVVLDYGNFPAVLTYSKVCNGGIGSEIIGENGSLKIARISQYADVTLTIGSQTQKIVGELTKAELMRGEAGRFADYIREPQKNRADYENAAELCLISRKVMDEIKKKAGLVYPNR